jgi:hypothetical protein
MSVKPTPAQPSTVPPAPAGEAPKEECKSTPTRPNRDPLPPPPDQPQPKFVCEQTKVVAEPVWQGKSAEFHFTVRNEGEGPLVIRIKPG